MTNEKQIHEDEEDYCPIHAGHLMPCRVCRYYAMIDRADLERKRRKEEALLENG